MAIFISNSFKEHKTYFRIDCDIFTKRWCKSTLHNLKLFPKELISNDKKTKKNGGEETGPCIVIFYRVSFLYNFYESLNITLAAQAQATLHVLLSSNNRARI